MGFSLFISSPLPPPISVDVQYVGSFLVEDLELQQKVQTVHEQLQSLKVRNRVAQSSCGHLGPLHMLRGIWGTELGQQIDVLGMSCRSGRTSGKRFPRVA